jgi:hypothetical protein
MEIPEVTGREEVPARLAHKMRPIPEMPFRLDNVESRQLQKGFV